MEKEVLESNRITRGLQRLDAQNCATFKRLGSNNWLTPESRINMLGSRNEKEDTYSWGKTMMINNIALGCY